VDYVVLPVNLHRRHWTRASGDREAARVPGRFDPAKITEVTRHRSVEMIRTYSRQANLFHDHSGAAFLW